MDQWMDTYKCQHGSRVMWAAVINDELVRPFQHADGVTGNYQIYAKFIEDAFMKLVQVVVSSLQKDVH